MRNALAIAGTVAVIIGLGACGGGGDTTVISTAPAQSAQTVTTTTTTQSEPSQQQASTSGGSEAEQTTPSSSSGSPPDVTGLTLPAAKKALSSAGYKANVSNTDTTFGIVVESNYTVCKQSPPRGNLVPILAQKYGC